MTRLSWRGCWIDEPSWKSSEWSAVDSDGAAAVSAFTRHQPLRAALWLVQLCCQWLLLQSKLCRKQLFPGKQDGVYFSFRFYFFLFFWSSTTSSDFILKKPSYSLSSQPAFTDAKQSIRLRNGTTDCQRNMETSTSCSSNTSRLLTRLINCLLTPLCQLLNQLTTTEPQIGQTLRDARREC